MLRKFVVAGAVVAALSASFAFVLPSRQPASAQKPSLAYEDEEEERQDDPAGFAAMWAARLEGTGELSPAMEQRLLGLPEGTRTSFELVAGEAFGERNTDMQQWVARKLLNELGDPDEKYNVGDVVQFPTPDGLGSYAGAVQQVRDDGAVLFDFNHPLAGQPVTFEVHVIGIL